MAEVKDLEKTEQEKTTPAMAEPPAESALSGSETRVNLRARWQAVPRKKRRRVIRLGVVVVILLVIAAILLKLLGGKGGGESQVRPSRLPQ